MPPLPPCKSMQKKHVWLQECSSSIQHMHTTTFFRLRLFWCSDLQTPQSAQLGIRQRAADTLKVRKGRHWNKSKTDTDTQKKQLHSREITCNYQMQSTFMYCVYMCLLCIGFVQQIRHFRIAVVSLWLEESNRRQRLGAWETTRNSPARPARPARPCPRVPSFYRKSTRLSSMQSSPIHFPQLSISCVYSVMIVMIRSWHSWHSSLSQRLQCQAHGHENHETQMIHSRITESLTRRRSWSTAHDAKMMQHDTSWFDVCDTTYVQNKKDLDFVQSQ